MSGPFVRKPTESVAGHSGVHPSDLETLRKNRWRLRQIIIQGNLRYFGVLVAASQTERRCAVLRS